MPALQRRAGRATNAGRGGSECGRRDAREVPAECANERGRVGLSGRFGGVSLPTEPCRGLERKPEGRGSARRPAPSRPPPHLIRLRESMLRLQPPSGVRTFFPRRAERGSGRRRPPMVNRLWRLLTAAASPSPLGSTNLRLQCFAPDFSCRTFPWARVFCSRQKR